jgi:indolepyruvate ferredoxin oxidoreductase alpha subunit
MAHGFDKGSGGAMASKTVAVIGDSTFLHTGINGLINSVYNGGQSTVLILDNRITGMTGHQPNAASGFTAQGVNAPAIDFEVLCRAVGVKHVVTVDPFDVDECLRVLKEETIRPEVSVIITNRPCIFADKSVIKAPYVINPDTCSGCKACLRIGCPAISWDAENKRAVIDAPACTGCGLCPKLCRFDSIKQID